VPFVFVISCRYLQALLKEIKIHSSLRHTNIVQFYGLLRGTCYGIVMEYIPNGSLAEFIDDQPERFCDEKWHPMKNQWASDIASGVRYIHHQDPPIIHMDLKLNNVLLDHGYKAKVIAYCKKKLKMSASLNS
jgi:interleukin-1 receptor-associated kinase 1